MDFSIDKKLQGFRQIAQEKLQNIFCTIPWEKDLIIEPCLIKPLEHVCGASWLRKKGIEKIYKFDPKHSPPKRKQFVYLISTNLLTFKNVLDQISAYYSQSSSLMLPEVGNKQYHVIVFPNILSSFEHLLEEEGLHGIVELYRFQWDFITLDTGIMSLELPSLYEDVFIRNNTALLSSVAHSFRLFNMVMKRPNLIFTMGENSEKLLNMVHRMENFKKSKCLDEANDNPDFNAMLIIDRSKDYPSALLTPVVYSGLLLEIHKFNSGTLSIDSETNKIQSEKLQFLKKEEDGAKKSETTHLRMNGDHDLIFNENKYRHFAEVIGLLSIQAKNLGVEGKMYSRDMKLHEMKEYVTNKLPKVAAQKKELFKHLILCETIVNEIGGGFEKLQTIEENILTNNNRKQIMTYIDELMATDAHKYNLLRLACLFHITIGLSGDEVTKFMTNYLNAFGYQNLTIFQNLFTAKLFPDTINLTKSKILSQISLPILKSQFQIEANKLKLLPTDTENVSNKKLVEASKLCPSFVFNGNYIPLIAQLANIILTINNFDDLNSKVGHLESLKMTGKLLNCNIPKTIREISISNYKKDINFNLPLKPRTLFIFVVGGLTYAEIAACNLVERMTSSKIVVASNAIVSGCDLLESIVKC